MACIWYDYGMKAAIDKAGRVVIPSEIRRRAGLRPGTELEIVLEDDASVRLVRDAPGPRLHRVGRRLVARPTARRDDLPDVDISALIDEERGRWPW
jgi:AbrB family looped-hinge helix DNA binding protein